MDAVFLSPPWGGYGYQKLETYSLDYLYPNFEDIIRKSLEFSGNLMLFLPKNTSVDEIINRLLPFYKSFITQNKG